LVLYRREGILDKKAGLLGRKGCLTLKIKLGYVQIFQPSVGKRGPGYACGKIEFEIFLETEFRSWSEQRKY
jgi:hypothetical protein